MTKPLGKLELEGNFVKNTKHEKPTVNIMHNGLFSI